MVIILCIVSISNLRMALYIHIHGSKFPKIYNKGISFILESSTNQRWKPFTTLAGLLWNSYYSEYIMWRMHLFLER